jgi:hypothetical protein
MKYIFVIMMCAVLMMACSTKPSTEQATAMAPAPAERWTAQKADEWYKEKGWLVGCNFSPSTAINQLEMWQAETFDTAAINKELGWAEGLGFNSVRVFLHHLLWQQDSAGFKQRLDTFLSIADRHHIGAMLVIFDGVWDPHSALGKQREPKPHVHNSGWVQSPGVEVLTDTAHYDNLKPYVQGVVRYLANDKRVQLWDLFNEPDNSNNTYAKEETKDKAKYALLLLAKTFEWARAVNPSQPLTAGVWAGDWSDSTKLKAIDAFMLSHSDVISFHNYDDPAKMEQKIHELQQYKRPLICSEYMARGNHSTFEGVLPVLKKYNVSAYNWGFVAGKTQTIYPWDSWEKKYTAEPALWFHDIFRKDGTPYSTKEVELIRTVTGKK